MSFLKSDILINTQDYKNNYQYNLQINTKLNELQELIKIGAEEKFRLRHQKKGKMLVRERICALCDGGTPFIEIGLFAAYNTYKDDIPAAGIIAGIGQIHNKLCMIIANDATVKGGSYYPLTVKKHLRAQEIALENQLPCIYLVDSGGAFLPMQAEVFPDKEHFGRIFYNQAQLSALGISQICAVMGSCTAGGAYIPAMSDQSIIVNNTGSIFLGGPPLVYAATGEKVAEQYLGGAKVHTQLSGVADYYARDDMHALHIIRDIIKNLGYKMQASFKQQSAEEPCYDAQEILGIWPQNLQKQVDIREILARVLDGSRLLEFKADYAPSIVTGFAHIVGLPCGIIANNGVLFSESALKATHFIEICTKEKIPLIFLQNISGFMVGSQYERSGIAKDGAKLVHAVATAKIPKITMLLGNSYGAGNYAMCGRAYAPRFLWSWPSSRISVMGGEQAAQVLSIIKREQVEREGKDWNNLENQEFTDALRTKYLQEGDPYYASARLWDDGIISMLETRNILAASLAISLNAPLLNTINGIYRM